MTAEIHFRMTLRATTMPLHKRLVAFKFRCLEATWRSGYATVCKTVYAGSIPAVASSPLSASPAWETEGGKPKQADPAAHGTEDAAVRTIVLASRPSPDSVRLIADRIAAGPPTSDP
jgi:hypothetical protein